MIVDAVRGAPLWKRARPCDCVDAFAFTAAHCQHNVFAVWCGSQRRGGPRTCMELDKCPSDLRPTKSVHSCPTCQTFQGAFETATQGGMNGWECRIVERGVGGLPLAWSQSTGTATKSSPARPI
eukprot:440145-Prymnesium_polylepis.2